MPSLVDVQGWESSTQTRTSKARDETPTPEDPAATAMDTTVSDANPPTQMQEDKDRPTKTVR